MAHWLFQGNPKYYRLTDGIRDFDEMYWQVTTLGKEMQPSDGVAIWVSGKDAGIYALAELTTTPKHVERFADEAYWNRVALTFRPQERPHVGIRFTAKLLDRPLLRKDLQRDAVLKDLLVIRAPSRTNFRLSDQQWARIKELCSSRAGV